ncbi:phosphonate ABC transporter, permease protein PhnE [Paracoccus sp. S-4012]|uniref:phosphonate ABC transporter, permease protein PhnE n=1 Tax=Paracoccus sp. S-4012 TaxID=2665648 RepID=UPI0012AF7B7A|nr:phosphonate ABC transporter, permease protein PhnE [Paracoccus sp. S-4012]MRX52111.1 phosphonate ABC transporter, permease protein PhnE [Paracoccus sp. S-4012]
MTAFASDAARDHAAFRLIRAKRTAAIAAPLLILAYLLYAAVAFDLAGVASRSRADNAVLLLQDFWSYKTHVTRPNRGRDAGEIIAAIEGSRNMTYAEGQLPGWIEPAPGGAVVELQGDVTVRFLPDRVLQVDLPEHAPLRIATTPDAIVLEGWSGPLPDWISASDERVGLTLSHGARVAVTQSKSEVFRRTPGWELFFFTLDSEWYPLSWGERLAAAVTQPGAAASMAHDFWTNKVWHHGDVAWAMVETVLMAFLGTIGAALLALPLAFLSARNFAPNFVARFATRRGYDFLRGVDALIWTVILSRAFGPGPLTGALAILLTDTGSFGKLFSEALENIDGRQVEGVRATGARGILRARWGVIPQVAPVILSQVLYYLESNTRSATVIGAIVGGGIGLLLTQAIVTQQDWEDVAYYIILIVLVVIGMDAISGRLRRRLIKGA